MHPKLQLLCQIYESSLESSKALDFDMLLKACFLKDLEEALLLLSHQQQTYFAYMCADSIKHLIKDKKASQASQKCLDLILSWLKKPESVTTEQLQNAASAAYTAVAATYAAVTAAYATNATNAANAAAYAANVASACTAYAIYAANHAIKVSTNKPKQSQLHLSFFVQAINFKGF